MKNHLSLYLEINEFQYIFLVGESDEYNNFKINYRLETPIEGIDINGIFDFEKQIYLYSLNSKGAPGYDVITPIKINSNEVLLINRGWIKKDLKGNININNIKSKSFEGIVKKITKPNIFKPENDIKNNIWYTLKLEDLQNFTGYKLNNFVLFLQNSQTNLVKNKIVSPDLPNNHLKYAITWYSVALSILLYFLYFRKKQ